MPKFSKSYHLRHAHEFQWGFKNGQKFVSKYLILFVWGNHLSHPRLGFALSKRCIALATRRNQIKRIVRENFRTRCCVPVDVIIVGRRPIVSITNHELHEHMEKNWKKIENWYKKH